MKTISEINKGKFKNLGGEFNNQKMEIEKYLSIKTK